jgi:hypothetical protein
MAGMLAAAFPNKLSDIPDRRRRTNTRGRQENLQSGSTERTHR